MPVVDKTQIGIPEEDKVSNLELIPFRLGQWKRPTSLPLSSESIPWRLRRGLASVVEHDVEIVRSS